MVGWRWSFKPHPQPLSEPTVTDQREVMERGVKYVLPLLIEEVLKSGFSVKYVDAFRIALTEEPKLLIKQKYS